MKRFAEVLAIGLVINAAAFLSAIWLCKAGLLTGTAKPEPTHLAIEAEVSPWGVQPAICYSGTTRLGQQASVVTYPITDKKLRTLDTHNLVLDPRPYHCNEE